MSVIALHVPQSVQQCDGLCPEDQPLCCIYDLLTHGVRNNQKIRVSPATTVILEATTSVTDKPTNACMSTRCMLTSGAASPETALSTGYLQCNNDFVCKSDCSLSVMHQRKSESRVCSLPKHTGWPDCRSTGRRLLPRQSLRSARCAAQPVALYRRSGL